MPKLLFKNTSSPGGSDLVTAQQNRLAAELEFYRVHETEWLQGHPGEYVVLKGTEVLGFYPAFNNAYAAGANAWGTSTDFLVRQVLPYEPTFFVLSMTSRFSRL